MFKPFFSITLLFLLQSFCFQIPEAKIDHDQPMRHIYYLASDELRGRETGTAGNDLAAAYIAEQFKAFGLQTAPGAKGYLQPINFKETIIPNTASLQLEGNSFSQGENLLLLEGPAIHKEITLVYAGYGWVDEETGHDDYKDLDVKDKMVLTIAGTPSDTGVRQAIRSLGAKKKWAAENGAIGVIQLYNIQYPWKFMLSRNARPSLRIAAEGDASSLVSGWINNFPEDLLQKLKEGAELRVQVESSGEQSKSVISSNVAGILPGTDPNLKEEYLLISAHYDHVGVGKPNSEQDSIYNGARDNAIGVAALLTAAEALAEQPPARSVLFLAVTGEEKGLLGSLYYAEHPLVPLSETIFNLNTDGAGYNDTTAISVAGYDRTGIEALIEYGARFAGLKVIADPAKEENLFDRSDNVSFARKGIPCTTLSPGFTSFDKTLQQHYHQPSDEADSLDETYVVRFCQAFAHTARQIAERPQRPMWKAGDKYEKLGKKLYGE